MSEEDGAMATAVSEAPGWMTRFVDWLLLRSDDRAVRKGKPVSTLSVYVSSDRMAEARWRRHNRNARLSGCPCGQPATVIGRRYPVRGRVLHETWRCADHGDVEGWVQARP